MKTGSDLLQSRINKGEPQDTSDKTKLIEQIPPIFKLFVESFEWKSEVVKDKHFYYLPFLEGGEVYLEKWDYKSKFSRSVISNEEEMKERGLLLIATSDDGIYLGTKGEDIDKIFSTTSSVEGGIIEIAENIFEFIRGLTDNLVQISENEEEYKTYLIRLGYQGVDLDKEVDDWKSYKRYIIG